MATFCRLNVRFYPAQDPDLCAWLTQLKALPFGGQTEAIKTVLRQGLAATSPVPTAAPTPPDLAAWLPEIRRALAAELDQRQFGATPELSVPAPDEHAAAEALLAQLTANLTLE